MGQRFEFEGAVHTKVGPVTARDERSGRQCMVSRSAAASLLGASAPAPPAGWAALDSDRVRAAFDRYHAAAETALTVRDPEQVRAVLAPARAEFLAALGLD